MPAARRKQEISIFHPKKKAPVAGSPPKSVGSPRPTTKAEEDVDVELPEGPFQEYKIMSSASTGWKYDVMKFNSREAVDVMTWQEPVKLNRKEMRKHDSGPVVHEAVGPMLGLDGKPVVGSDGRVVMVDADGRPIHNTDGSSHGKEKGGGGGGGGGRKKFQKKTRQVFIVPDHIRALRREEKNPWVMEDATGGETWIGQLEEVSRAETHGFFMPTSENKFQFVPAHRWYKFQKKQNHAQLSAEEVEKLMEQQKKNRDPEFWLMRRRNGQAASAATSAIFKAEAEGRVISGGSGSLMHTASQSLGPGGRRLKAVDKDNGDLFGDEEGGSRRKREDDGEGDMDEQLFEEEFADDDEMAPADEDDEEAKDAEERLKKEYKSANKQREGYLDESEDEDGDELTKDGRAMKKMIRQLEKNDVYDSDEDKNPYASSDDEEEEEQAPPTNEPVIPPQPSPTPSRSQTPSATPTRITHPSTAGSRATSPGAPGLGGHAEVAKRATSPKVPKVKTNGANRATSPLGGVGPSSRATSPVAGGSRAGSPVNGSSAGQKSNKKRKASDAADTAQSPEGASMKKRKPSPAPVEYNDVVAWLGRTPGATTKDCIKQFSKHLRDKPKQLQFTKMMKEKFVVRDGILTVKPPEKMN